MEHWPEQAAEAETQLKQDVHHNVSDSNDRLVTELIPHPGGLMRS